MFFNKTLCAWQGDLACIIKIEIGFEKNTLKIGE
jgi:hypothetical protein